MAPIRAAIVCALITCQIAQGWGSEAGTSVEKKQKTNFYGTLETQQGNTTNVENISIEGKYKQIPVYERPQDVDKEKITTKKRQKVSIEEIPLDIDPSSDLVVTYIDLNEIKEIKVPNAHQQWVYRRDDSKRALYYVEISVISKGGSQTSYLISRSTKIWCHGISDSGPEEKKVPLPAVKTLTIDGFCVRDDETGQCLIQPERPNGKRQRATKKADITLEKAPIVQPQEAPAASAASAA